MSHALSKGFSVMTKYDNAGIKCMPLEKKIVGSWMAFITLQNKEKGEKVTDLLKRKRNFR